MPVIAVVVGPPAAARAGPNVLHAFPFSWLDRENGNRALPSFRIFEFLRTFVRPGPERPTLPARVAENIQVLKRSEHVFFIGAVVEQPPAVSAQCLIEVALRFARMGHRRPIVLRAAAKEAAVG